VRFLFALRDRTLMRVFERPIRDLCEGGDEVQILLESGRKLTGSTDPLEADLAGVTVRSGVEPNEGAKVELGAALRVWLDYLRYFEPELARGTKYRERAGRPLPPAVRADTEWAASESPELRRALAAGLRAVERSLPVAPEVMELLERGRPDALLVSPLLKRTSPQVSYVRAARRLGIPSALCVASWDNLTTTGLIHEIPDRVMVWNEAQREEAIRLHNVPAERVVATGAPRFDAWFEHGPSTSREEYCGQLGLPADSPHILYVGSHKFTAPDEAEWVSRWIAGLRASGRPELRDVPVVVRPHPGGSLHRGEKGMRRLASKPRVVVHPHDGAIVVDEASLSDYYDSIHHAAAVVGINTSAMIEAAVVGRGVHVLLAKRYRETQEDSPHFDHLRTVAGGWIVATNSREEHAEGLARALRGEDGDEVAERARSFLASFIRPHGLERPATPIMVGSVRELAGTPSRAAGPEMDDLAEVLGGLLLPDRGRQSRSTGRVRSPDASASGSEPASRPRRARG
jgi:hypothetical protein